LLRSVQLAYIRGAVHEPGIAAFANDVVIDIGRIGRELANNLLEYVLERYDALYVTVFVDNEGDAPAAPLKLHKLCAERCAFGNEVGLLEQLYQRFLVKRKLCKIREASQMQDADDFIDIVPIHGQSCVLALVDDSFDLVLLVIEIDADDFIMRHHDIVDRDFFEIENADKHLPIAVRNAAACFVYDCT
jgi:hypothetical protein